jgi:medium-chain acyl-[acyl-carrier-protein] hydrolase
MLKPDEYVTDAFVIRSSEVDSTGRLALPSLLGLLQEAANLNAGRLGFSIADLAGLGLGWVLLRLNINVLHWPGNGDTLHLATFPTHRDRYFISRDYHGFDQAGRVLLRASSTWLTFSTQTRTMSLLPALMQTVPLPAVPFLPKLPPKLRFAGEPTFADTCRVRRHHVDHNRHTNNSAYGEMLTDALPPDLDNLLIMSEIDLFFKTETFLGDALLAETAPADRPGQFWHRLSRPADGKEIMVARTAWRPPGTGSDS